MSNELVGVANLHGYLVHSVKETTNFDVTHPTHPVEKGINIADHVEREPIILKLNGLLVRPTPERVERLVTALYDYEKNGTLCTYQGRRIYKNMLLSDLQITATNKVMNGYEFSCTLTEVEVAQSSYVNPTIARQTKKVSASGRVQTFNKKTTNVYHKVKKGDTYWALSKKYGTSISQLQKWNKYEPTKIPIGVKLRVV